MNEEKKASKGSTKAVLGSLVSAAGRVIRLFCRTMKFIIVGKDRPFFRPEVTEFCATVRRWLSGPGVAEPPRIDKAMEDHERRMEVVDSRGRYRLIRFEKADGSTGYLLEEDGRPVSSDDDGDEFYDRVGMISSTWELFLAVHARGEPWADRVPIPGTEFTCKSA